MRKFSLKEILKLELNVEISDPREKAQVTTRNEKKLVQMWGNVNAC